jgi:hypothetical protein
MASAAREHSRQHGARGVEVSLDVDAPDALPVGVVNLHASANNDSGIRAEQIDLACAGDQPADLRFVGNIHSYANAANIVCDLFRCRSIYISADNVPRAFCGEAPAQGRSNSIAAASHYYCFSAKKHL